jgi:hypothetical protein
MKGRHPCTKLKTDPTYNERWSGVSCAPHCIMDCTCLDCGTRLHAEYGEHYCPGCDNYVKPDGKYHEAR